MTKSPSTIGTAPDTDKSSRRRTAFTNWLYKRTLPVWQQIGVDWDAGGFHERLNTSLQPIASDNKRLIVQARQIYVFSHAAIENLLDSALDVALHGFKFITDNYRSNGGWRHSVQRDGTPIDDHYELYDQAFFIFAMAWLFMASGNQYALDLADETIEFIDKMLLDDLNGGYREGLDAAGELFDQPRRQNPHMHLVEAFLALHDATGDNKYLARVESLILLARNHFIVDGSLREYFTSNWQVLPDDRGRLIEPGHHFEWVWLLHKYVEMGGRMDGATSLAKTLYEFSINHGIDSKSSGTLDLIDCNGFTIKPTRRVWPQTEALKAHSVRSTLAGDQEAHERLSDAITILMRDHLNSNNISPGGWLEQVDHNNKRLIEVMPASTLYHLVCANSEIKRLATYGHSNVF